MNSTANQMPFQSVFHQCSITLLTTFKVMATFVGVLRTAVAVTDFANAFWTSAAAATAAAAAVFTAVAAVAAATAAVLSVCLAASVILTTAAAAAAAAIFLLRRLSTRSADHPVHLLLRCLVRLSPLLKHCLQTHLQRLSSAAPTGVAGCNSQRLLVLVLTASGLSRFWLLFLAVTGQPSRSDGGSLPSGPRFAAVAAAVRRWESILCCFFFSYWCLLLLVAVALKCVRVQRGLKGID